MDVVIYHNPRCATSRNVLGLIHALASSRTSSTTRSARRPGRCSKQLARPRRPSRARRCCAPKARPSRSSASTTPALSDEALLAAISDPSDPAPAAAGGHAERRAAVPAGRELIAPPPPQRGEFVKENGERVIDEQGRRVATG